MVNIDGMTAEQIAEIEALQAQMKEIEDKNTNLGDKIYKLKKENKEAMSETNTWLTEEDIRNINTKMDFERNNPELATNEKFLEYTSKGIWYEEAKILVEHNDPTIQARQISSTTNFTDWDLGTQKTTYTQEDTAKMTPSEYKTMWTLKEQGKVIIK